MGFCAENAFVCAILVFVLLVIVYQVVMARERMTNAIYLDQIVAKNPDPLLMKYTGRERDITGMSARDYYYENDIDSRNLVSPQYLEGNSNYVDHTDYLGMPLQYRPANRVPSVAKRMASMDTPMKPASTGAMQMATR